MIHTGTSGYHYKHWCFPSNTVLNVASFYQSTSTHNWLTEYSKTFKSVEINCTRYRKLTPKMCKNWIAKVPKDFVFTIKAGTYITHNKKLNDFAEWWGDFAECLNILEEQLGCVLFQFHGSFKNTRANVEKLMLVKTVIPENIKCGFEFRDSSWFELESCEWIESIITLFSGSWAQVVNLVPEVRDKKMNFGNLAGGIHYGVINPKFVYLRFHGTSDYSCGTYDSKRLMTIISTIKSLISEDDTVWFAYFNNVDTWTMLPFTNSEGHYSQGVPVNRHFEPSAVHDAKITHHILSNIF